MRNLIAALILAVSAMGVAWAENSVDAICSPEPEAGLCSATDSQVSTEEILVSTEAPVCVQDETVGLLDPTAACRMKPQCSTDSDCDSFCGASGGHCVHSRCPIRICKCS